MSSKKVIKKEFRLCKKCGTIRKWEEFRPNGNGRTPKRVCIYCKHNSKGILDNIDHYELQCYERILLETGKAPFDHTKVNHEINQVCLVCGQIKELNEFRIRRGKGNKDDYINHSCKLCEAYYTAQWRINNPERAEEYSKQYRSSGRAKENYINLAHRNLLNHLYKRAKNNAKRSKVDFNLDKYDIVIPEKCPYLNIPLTSNVGCGHKRNRDSYSIDRINPKKGYVKGNVQIISRMANTMKNEASIDELITFAENVLKIHKYNKDEDIV